MLRAVLANAIILAASTGAVVVPGGDDPTVYPPTRRVDQVDTFHGTKVEDPYRWLEADVRTSREVAAQNEVTAAYLANIPEAGRRA